MYANIIPVESTESNRCFCDIADVTEANTAAKEDCESNEAAEPKGHGQGISTEEDELVVGDGWELVQGCEAEVDCCDQAENAGEEEEVDLGRRHVAPVIGPPVGNYSCC